MGKEIFYVWIAVFDNPEGKKCHFYIFNTKYVQKFDNINLPCYQITDNQQTHLYIRDDGYITNNGIKNDYSCFNQRFYNDWNSLEIEMK